MAAALALAVAACEGGPEEEVVEVSASDQVIIDALRRSAARALESGDHPAAASHFGKLHARMPDDAWVVVGYLDSLRRVGAGRDAIRVAEQGFAVHGNDPAFLTAVAKVQLAANRPGDALGTLSSALNRAPGDWRLYALSAMANDMMDRFDAAARAYDQALRLSPGNPTVINNKALSMAQAGRIDAAIALLREMLARARGGHAQLRQNLALLYAFKGDMKEYESLARLDLTEDMVKRNLEAFRALRDPDAVKEPPR